MAALPINIHLPQGFLDEETRCDYLISSEMKAVWAVELDLISEFQRVCEKHHLTYYASGGTMLGAMRHKGFIPWDDDVDLMMMRSEYEKLCQIAPKEFTGRYFWQTEQTDHYSARGHAQLRNSETTGILLSEEKTKLSFNQGIFIDIFPMDNIPDDPQEKDRFYDDLSRLRADYQAERDIAFDYHFEWRKDFIRPIGRFIKHCFHRFFLKSKFDQDFNTYETLAKTYMNEPTKRVVLTPFYIPRYTWEADLFSSYTMEPFEFMSIPIPCGYDRILSIQYKDWHKFVRGGNIHGGVIFDPYVSYTQHNKK